MADPHIVFVSPSLGGAVSNVSAQRALAKSGYRITTVDVCSSLLTWNFNRAWATMLNLRETDGATHFLMLHSDVTPLAEGWLDQMFQEMRLVGAQVLSAVVPIKGDMGLSSTARDTDRWHPRQLPCDVVDRPRTWTAPDLLVNTGLLLVDVSGEWVTRICFTMNDQIVRDIDGRWTADIEPEDWNFSRQCRAVGVAVYATRAIALDHIGTRAWSSLEENTWPLISRTSHPRTSNTSAPSLVLPTPPGSGPLFGDR